MSPYWPLNLSNVLLLSMILLYLAVIGKDVKFCEAIIKELFEGQPSQEIATTSPLGTPKTPDILLLDMLG